MSTHTLIVQLDLEVPVIRDTDELVTTNDVAERFCTSPSTVRYWRSIGYGPIGRRVGRRVLYSLVEVEAFWETLKETPPRGVP